MGCGVPVLYRRDRAARDRPRVFSRGPLGETAETAQASSERVGAHLMMCTRTPLFSVVRPSPLHLPAGPFFPFGRAMRSFQDAGAISESQLRRSSRCRLPLACNGTAQRDEHRAPVEHHPAGALPGGPRGRGATRRQGPENLGRTSRVSLNVWWCGDARPYALMLCHPPLPEPTRPSDARLGRARRGGAPR